MLGRILIHVVVDLDVDWSPEGNECPSGDDVPAMQNDLGVVMVGEWMVR